MSVNEPLTTDLRYEAAKEWYKNWLSRSNGKGGKPMTTPDWLERTSLLMGPDKMERFHRAHVLVVGTGGVGAYAAEMLVRAGIGRLTLLDADRVQPSNINRQLCALHSTVGEEKSPRVGAAF